jgi:hypothetical protein
MTPATPSQVRAELLGEHFNLRRFIEEARDLLGRSETSDALRLCVERLADALFFHSRHEEQALWDALAPNAVLDEAHIREHARLVTVLRDLRTADEATRRVRIAEVVDELESHMTEEEGILLAVDEPADAVAKATGFF